MAPAATPLLMPQLAPSPFPFPMVPGGMFPMMQKEKSYRKGKWLVRPRHPTCPPHQHKNINVHRLQSITRVPRLARARVTRHLCASPQPAAAVLPLPPLRPSQKEEEDYALMLIRHFKSGHLKDEPASGVTLRAYLADKLDCEPMRITKKFNGDASIGKVRGAMNIPTPP